jgi:hypothetical protein
MTRRIALWFLAGFIVACGSVLFAMAAAPSMPSDRAFWTFVEITAPASLLHHFPLKYYWFVLLNASTYAVLGFAIELFRRNFVRHISN